MLGINNREETMDLTPTNDKYLNGGIAIWNKIKQFLQGTDLLCYTALFIWLSFSFLRTTCFYELLGLKAYSKVVLYTVLFFLALDFAFCQKRETEDCLVLFLCSLFALLAYKRVSLLLAVSILILFSARRLSFQKLSKRLLLFYSAFVSLVILCAAVGLIEDVLFYEDMGARVRHSLGFTYCSYSSHYVLTITMLYLVVRESIRIWETLPALGINVVVYYFTDTKTDLLLCILVLLLALLLGNRKGRCLVKMWQRLLVGSLPVLFLLGSYVIVRIARFDVAIWGRINEKINGRLLLGQNAIEKYGVHFLGKKIKWVGVGQLAKNQELVYNYVDNIYLQTLLAMGIVFTLLWCLLLGRSLAGSLYQGYRMRAVVVFVFLLHGLLDPQLRSLCYNPFLLLLFSTESGLFMIGIKDTNGKGVENV